MRHLLRLVVFVTASLVMVFPASAIADVLNNSAAIIGNWDGTSGPDTMTNESTGSVSGNINATNNNVDYSSGGGNTIFNYGTVDSSIYGNYNRGNYSSGGSNTVYNQSGGSAQSIYGSRNSGDHSTGSGNAIHNYGSVKYIYGTINYGESSSGGGNNIYNLSGGSVQIIYGTYNDGRSSSGGGNTISNYGTVEYEIYGSSNSYGSHNPANSSSGGGNTIRNYGTVGSSISGSRNSGEFTSGGGNTIYNFGTVSNHVCGSENVGKSSSGGGNAIYNYGTVNGSIVGSYNSGENSSSTGNAIYNHGTVGGSIYGDSTTGTGASGGNDAITNSGTVGGSIHGGDGNDTVTMQTGPESVGGTIDGGSGTDTIVYSDGTWTQGLAKVVNFENEQVNATGTLTLSGAWDLSGTTVTVSGTLIVPGVLGSDGLVVYSSGHCDITGTVNTGNTYLAGTMRLNGTLNSPTTTITTSGSLWGTGTINGRLTVNGGLAPGNSIGTLTVNGSVVFNNSAAFIVEVDHGGASDLLAVNGTVAINGGTLFTSLPVGLYTHGFGWDVLTATGGVSGNFSQLQGQPNSTTLYLVTVNDGDKVRLEVWRNSFASFASTDNEKGLGGGLDALVPLALQKGGDWSDFITTVDFSYGASDIRTMLGQLNPEMYDAFSWAAMRNSQVFSDVLSARAGLLHLSAALKAPAKLTSQGLVELASAEVPAGGLVPAAPGGRGWSFWARLIGGHASQKATDQHPGYSAGGGGAVFGGDGRLTPWLRLGFGLGMVQSDLDWSRAGFEGDQRGLHLGLYALAENGPWHLQASLAFSKYENTATRPVSFGSVEQTASASFDGEAVLARLAAGYDFKAACWLVGPVAELSFLNTQEDGFSEGGAGMFNVSMRERENGYLLSSLGFRAARRFQARGLELLPRLELAWQHNANANGRDLTASFAGYGEAPFTLRGAGMASDLLAAKAGVSLLIGGRATAFIDYSLLAGGDFTSHLFSLGLELSF